MIEQELLVNIVGTQNVINKQAILDQYASDMSFVNAIKPDCIVKPKNSDDIEKIVKLARTNRDTLDTRQFRPAAFSRRYCPQCRRSCYRRLKRYEKNHQSRPVKPGGHVRARRDIRRIDTGGNRKESTTQHTIVAAEYKVGYRQHAGKGAGYFAHLPLGYC